MEHDTKNNRVKFRFKTVSWSLTGMRNRWIYYLEQDGQAFMKWAIATEHIDTGDYKITDMVRKTPGDSVLGYRVTLLKDKPGYQTLGFTDTVSLTVNMENAGDDAKIASIEAPNLWSWFNGVFQKSQNFNCVFSITKVLNCVDTEQENKVLLEVTPA